MANKESGKALAEALKHNSVLTALDVSNNTPYTNNDGPGFAQELAIGIKDNGALTKLNISYNSIEQGEALRQIIEYCYTKGIKLVNHESEWGGDY